MKIKTNTNLLLLAAIVCVFQPFQSYACSCYGEPHPYDAIQSADMVFIGKAISNSKYNDESKITFSLIEIWKGEKIDPVEINTYYGGSACGLGQNLEVGNDYLVYAYKDSDNNFNTNSCTRTGLLKYSEEDIKCFNSPVTCFITYKAIEWLPLTCLLLFYAALISFSNFLYKKIRS